VISGQMYAQLGFVADFDAAAIRRLYAYPPVTLTPEERAEADRLDGIADDIFALASALGFNGGTDAAFETEP